MADLLSNARVVRVERTDEDVAWLAARLGQLFSGATASVLVPAGGEEMPPAVVNDLERRAVRNLDDVRLIVRTSGSTTGHGRMVGLSGEQLKASITATDERIGGPGTWVLALAPHHIAGLQVVARSVLAGTTPVVLTGSFDAGRLALGIETALARDPNSRVHVSLVPTQLVDALASPRAADALAQCTSVLVGGAAADAGLVARARAASMPVLLTYGMSETCGGCFYDGRPLRGARVALGEGPDSPGGSGRLWIGGPMVMSGYLDGDLGVIEHDGARWLATSDLGHLDDGRLVVDGRIDDVIVTGGLKVAAGEVAQAVRATGMAAGATVVGLEDPRWGQVVTAVVVPSANWTGPQDLREAVARALPRSHAPRVIVTAPDIPMLGSGKVDRLAARRLASAARDDGTAWSRD